MAGKEGIGNKWETRAGQMAGVVFVYITHYIFMNTKELHEHYMDTESGKRLKRVRLYSLNQDRGLLLFSRQRYGRIVHREDSHITENDRTGWENKFKIEMDFFYMGDGGTVLGCSLTEWEKYFSIRHPNTDEVEELANKKGSFEWDLEVESLPVTKGLKDMMSNMDKYIGTPIYSIYYYIKHNKPYEAESNLQIAMDFLGKARIREWDAITEKVSERYLQILEKHYDYIRMKRKVKEIESKDRTYM